jgi:hypothetical protein
MREGIHYPAMRLADGPELNGAAFPAFFTLSSLAVVSFPMASSAPAWWKGGWEE